MKLCTKQTITNTPGPDNQENKSVSAGQLCKCKCTFLEGYKLVLGMGGVTGYFGMNGMRLEWNVPHRAFLKHELHFALHLHLAKPKKHQIFGIDYG